jgi:hypothetical protein
MILRPFRILIVALTLLLSSLAIVRAQTASGDPLKPYTACKVPGDLRIKQVTRRPAGDNYREVVTDSGKQRVSVVDGYRVMFAYPDLTYYFANVKIEQSAPDRYTQDKEILINQLKHYSTIKEATGMSFTDKMLINGFEHYGIDRDKIDVGAKSESTFSFMIRLFWSSPFISLTSRKPSFLTTDVLKPSNNTKNCVMIS